MKLNKQNREVLYLGRNSPMMGAAQLESGSAEKDLKVLVDTRLNTSQHALWQRRQMVSWAASDKALPAG